MAENRGGPTPENPSTATPLDDEEAPGASELRTSRSRAEGRRPEGVPQPKGEWISIEERTADGRPRIPRLALQATEGTIYDPDKHTDLALLINTGNAPEGAIIGQYKLYDIAKFSMRGWRITAEALVELPPTRGFEQAWFEAFGGQQVKVNDPGIPGSVSTSYSTTVTKSEFSKKRISQIAEDSTINEQPVFEGRLWMKKTWRSVLWRRRGEIGRYVMAALIGALIGSTVTTLLGTWDRLMAPSGGSYRPSSQPFPAEENGHGKEDRQQLKRKPLSTDQEPADDTASANAPPVRE